MGYGRMMAMHPSFPQPLALPLNDPLLSPRTAIMAVRAFFALSLLMTQIAKKDIIPKINSLRLSIMGIHKAMRACILGFFLFLNTSLALAVWQSTSSLNTTRGAAGVIAVDGKIYAIGGIDGWQFLKTSEYTSINPDGSLAPWKDTTPLNEDRGFFGVAHHNGYVYAVGGGNGPNGHNLLRTVERAKLLKDGGLGAWQQEKHLLKIPRRCSKILIIGDHIYAFGGFGGTLLDSIERARINDDGSLSQWELLDESFTIPRYIHDMESTSNVLYSVGGHAEKGGTGISSVEFTTKENGQLKPWQETSPLNQGRYGLSVKVHNGYLYAMGGLNGATFFDLIERSKINADGSLAAWETIAPLPAPFADLGIATHNNWIYILGGTNRDGYFNTVYKTRFDELDAAPVQPSQQTSKTQAPTPSKPVYMPNKGTILEIIDGGTYAYIKIDLGGHQHEWLATGKTDVKVGDTVHYSLGIFMQNFYSKALDRTFELIRFVGKLEKLPDGWN